MVFGFILVTAIGLGRALYHELRWKRFAAVVPGELYRAGQLTPGQLGRAIQRYRLRTVVSLTNLGAERERQICAEQGAKFISIPMPASGLGTEEQFAQFLRLAQEPANRPLLVHCQAGVARTGAAIALFRVREEGWPVERALAELRSFERRGRIDPALSDWVMKLADQDGTANPGRGSTTAGIETEGPFVPASARLDPSPVRQSKALVR